MPSPGPDDDAVHRFLAECRDAWALSYRLAAEVENLDEHRRVVFSHLVKQLGDLSDKKAEAAARACDAYQMAVNDLANKRLDAAAARANAEWMSARLDVWRTREASRRAERMK